MGTIFGTSGNDTLNGTAGNDTFNASQGGEDTVNGLAGNDIINFGAAFDEGDSVNGGTGNDQITLNGDYDMLIGATTITSIERIYLVAGHSYNFTIDNGAIAAGADFAIDGSHLGASDRLFFTASSDIDSNITMRGGAGDDLLTGGKFHTTMSGGGGDDTITLSGGLNVAVGGDGDDVFNIDAPISSSSRIDGGTGADQVYFSGNFSGGQVLGRAMGENISDFGFTNGNDYAMTLRNGMVADGQTQYFYGNSLSSSYWVHFNASANLQGNVSLQGGQGDDILIGGAGNDSLDGQGGIDRLTGGAGSDKFYFEHVTDSTSASFDRITDFNTSADHFSMTLPAILAAVDPTVTSGVLTAAHFDTNLAAAVGASQLHVHDAVLFTPTSGYLTGHTLLIVDDNGVAGYQAGADYVIDVTGISGTLTASNFL